MVSAWKGVMDGEAEGSSPSLASSSSAVGQGRAMTKSTEARSNPGSSAAVQGVGYGKGFFADCVFRGIS